MAFRRTLIFGVLLAASFANVAYAQKQKTPDPTPMQADEERRRKDAETVDKQYKATLERTKQNPAAAAANDPWQNMRGADDSKAKR